MPSFTNTVFSFKRCCWEELCRVCVPAPGLIHFGLDQQGSVPPHSQKRQEANQRHHDEQDGQACRHQPRPGHPDVALVSHVPGVLTCLAAETDRDKRHSVARTPPGWIQSVLLRLLTGRVEVDPGGACRCRGGGSSRSGTRRNSCSLKSRAEPHT